MGGTQDTESFCMFLDLFALLLYFFVFLLYFVVLFCMFCLLVLNWFVLFCLRDFFGEEIGGLEQLRKTKEDLGKRDCLVCSYAEHFMVVRIVCFSKQVFWPRKIFKNHLANPLVKSVTCVPPEPYELPPVMRILMPNVLNMLVSLIYV